MERQRSGTAGFSLIELVIVVVLIGLIASIAIPRMSRGSAGAADSAMAANLEELRKALETYQAEHQGNYPTSGATLAGQLTSYTDVKGNTSTVRTGAFTFGPYLQKIPVLPLGDQKGITAVGPTPAGNVPQAVVPGFGWLYDGAGNIYPNTGQLSDATGKTYMSY